LISADRLHRWQVLRRQEQMGTAAPVRERPRVAAPPRRAREDAPSILIHGINYAPELLGVGRFTGDLAVHLAACGHQVEVITAVPHYPGWRVRNPYRAGRYYREVTDDVNVVRCPLMLHTSGRGLWRLLMPLSFAMAAAPIVLWRAWRKRPDVLLCIEPTLLSAPAALLAAKLVGARALLYVQDLEVDAAFAVGHLRNGLFKRAAALAEKFLLRRFDGLITISHRMRDRLAEKGMAPERLQVVRNWTDLSKIKPLQAPNPFRQELGLGDGDFAVVYAGSIGPKQALHVVLEAARKLADQSRFHFVIAGDGPLKAELTRRYAGLRNVHWLPLQPDERFCELLNVANLHILPQARAAADLVLPSKLGAMLASGRSVLVQAEEGTELDDLVRGVAVSVPPGDVDALVDGITAASQAVPDLEKGRALAALFSRDRNLAAVREIIFGAAAQEELGAVDLLAPDLAH
jgi:colanic acid biosynthesis glycosyl transferase WcaI